MRTDLWSQFGSMVAGAPRVLATVHAHHSDGTSSVQTFEGGSLRALGQLNQALPYNAWIQDGRVIETGPNLPLSNLTA